MRGVGDKREARAAQAERVLGLIEQTVVVVVPEDSSSFYIYIFKESSSRTVERVLLCHFRASHSRGPRIGPMRAERRGPNTPEGLLGGPDRESRS